MSTWTDDEISLLEALRPVCTTREIHNVFESLALPRSTEAIAKKARNLGWKFKELDKPVCHGLLEEHQQAIQDMLQQRDQILQSIIPERPLTSSEKCKITVSTREQVSDLYEELADIRRTVPRTGSISLKKASGSGLSLVLMLSDHHMGKIIKDESHRIIYNTTIATARILDIPSLIQSNISPDDLSMADEIVVALIGDHVDGEDVYPGQNLTLETHVREQVLKVTKAHWNMFKQLREFFPLVRIVTARGNHGRSGGSLDSNWDNIFYQHLALLVDMENDPGLTIRNRYDEFNNFVVRGWRGHIRHKAPVQCDTAAARAKFSGWRDIHGYDFMCYGHWHHWGINTYNKRPIFRNGSLGGGDDYAEGFGSYDVPCQLLFGVTNDTPCAFIVPLRF